MYHNGILYIDNKSNNQTEEFEMTTTKLNIMAEYGISWCESGETKTGKFTNICGNCINYAPSKCDCVSDECADLDDDVVANYNGFNN